MLNRKWLYISFLCSVTFNLTAQTASKIDTFFVSDSSKVIFLKKKFVLPSSLKITSDGIEIHSFKVQQVESKIELKEINIFKTIIVEYKYLVNGLPIQLGPGWKSLPSVKNTINQFDVETTKKNKNLSEKSDFYSSGSIHRKLNLSSLGNSDFIGGLQMQINGLINKNINVSGIISDQNVLIQPDGLTRELEELDKVYLMVQHPNFNFTAGDILYQESNNFLKFERKLTGLKNNFSLNNFSGSSVYAGSKGTFKILEIYGRDGDQGPYQLISNNGNKDIIVLSGTEKVWANGKKLIRGENHDYTIDYSLGQVFFTPEILIYDDIKLLFEYEYSDFDYEKSFTGGNLKKIINGLGELTFGIYQESDIYDKNSLITEFNKGLIQEKDGITQIETAFEDDKGDYFLQDSVYVFDPDRNNQNFKRYFITFNYDLKGFYKRNISNNGRVYYQFVSEIDKSLLNDYYSPKKTIYAPEKLQFGYLDGKISLNKYIHINSQLRVSKKDPNLINSSSINSGGAFNNKLLIDSLKIFKNQIEFEFSQSTKDKNYFSLGRENDVNQVRFWNLDSIIKNEIEEKHFKTTILNRSFGKTAIEISTLKNKKVAISRFKINTDIYQNRLKDSFINFLKVKKINGEFYRLNSLFYINNEKYSPFISFLNEKKSFTNQFHKLAGGLKIKTERWNLESGLEKRVDDNYHTQKKFEKFSEDIIGSINYTFESKEGWSNQFLYKKRIKTILNQEGFDYSLANFDLRFFKSKSIFNLRIQGRKEESLKEEVAIIYDSLGVGLGQYRYDPIFNVYIPDQNGAFISYRLPTGGKKQNTLYQGMQNLSLDLGKIYNLPKISIHINSKQNFSGKYENISEVLNYDFLNKNILQSNFQFRGEAIYLEKNHLLVWTEIIKNLYGSDPRGNELIKRNEIGFLYKVRVYNKTSIKNEFKSNYHSIKTNISDQKNRAFTGWWNEIEIQLNLNNSFNFDLSFLSGSDRGRQGTDNFIVYANGLSLKSKILFKKTGSLNSQIKLVKSSGGNNISYIPPEALNGFALGESFLLQSRLQYFITKSLSSVLSINLINDDRYDNILNIEGEIRAYF